ncbi:AbrB/MazE/SpoVT family DNA-binding domain-containing protein [Candidatus Curtissbacteria bacterium]|nr:AbrB/MazE/SpoVT family DNA-binding domain-containing protein [Candidatus Curtissbacteria bacterium]
MKQVNVNVQETWLKVLGKGMVTLPKKWRQDLGMIMGDVVKAKKEGSKITIEPQKSSSVPYRIYSDAEIDQFIKEDKLEKRLAKKIKNDLSRLS